MTLPVNLTTIEVTGTFLDTEGNPLSGTLTFAPPPELVDINTAIMYSTPVTVTLGVGGTFTVTLIATDNPTLVPAGWSWTVTEQVRGSRSYTIYVPSTLGDSVDLSNLVPMPTLDGTTTTTTVGDAAPGYAGLGLGNTFTGANDFQGSTTFDGPVTLATPLPISQGGTGSTSVIWESAMNITAVKTTAYTLAAWDFVPANVVGASVTHTLPTAPPNGTRVGGKIVATAGSHTATFTCGGTDVFNVSGGPATLVLSLLNQGFIAEYQSGIWYVQAVDLPLSQLDSRYLTQASLPLGIGSGGTGQITQQASLNALTGTQSAGKYVRSDGTNSALAAIQAGDLPDIPIAGGGTGQTTQQAAINALTGTQSSGKFLRSDGTNATLSPIGAGDLPNIPITGGGTGQSTAPAVGQTLVATSTTATKFVTRDFNVMAFGAKGDGTGDDYTSINNAITACSAAGGGTVYFPYGHYPIGTPLAPPSGVNLKGDGLFGMYPSGTTTGPSPTILLTAAFTGAAAINLNGASTAITNVRIEGLVLNGSNVATGSIAGILMTGSVTNVALRHVVASTFSGVGFSVQVSGGNNAVPYFERCTAWQNGSHGFDIYTTDTIISTCMAFKNGGNGFNLQRINDCQFLGNRAEHNTLNGFFFNDSAITSTVLFQGCTTDQNNQHGFAISSAGGNGPIQFNGCSFRRDGNNAGSGSTTYAGISITGSTVPVIINGVNVSPQSGDTGGYGPHYGLSVTTSSMVSVTGGYFGCDSTGKAFNWDGSGVLQLSPGIITGVNNGTGFPGTTTSAVASSPYGGPGPSLNNYIAWTCDPWIAPTSGAALTAGTRYLNLIEVESVAVTTKLWYEVQTAGATPTTNESWAMLYNMSGAIVASAALDSVVASSGLISVSWSASALLEPGLYWVGVVFNAATVPAIYRSSTSMLAAINGNLGASAYRAAVNGTSITATTPGTITPSSNSQTNALPFWFAIS